MHIFHDWLYKYDKYPARVHAFSTGPGYDWIDKECSICNKVVLNKHYQEWLDYLNKAQQLMELERKKYGHPLLHSITTT